MAECTSLLYFVVRVRCRRTESSRSLSHLLMSFLFYVGLTNANHDINIHTNTMEYRMETYCSYPNTISRLVKREIPCCFIWVKITETKWKLCWCVVYVAPKCTCPKSTPVPQCYVCNASDRHECESSQFLQTCPSNDVCLLVHEFFVIFCSFYQTMTYAMPKQLMHGHGLVLIL